jgi:hypothetical protein
LSIATQMPLPMPPREWTQIIAAEEDPAMGKSKVAGNGTNKMGELLGVLSPVATELVHLAGSIQHAERIRCASPRALRQRSETCARGLRFRQSLCFSARMLWLHSIREPPQTSRT